LSSLSSNSSYIYLRHLVFGIPYGRSELEIETNNEYYLYRIYIDGNFTALQKITRVIYYLHPSFSTSVVETTDRENNFEYRDFASRSFELQFLIYLRDQNILNVPYSGTYYLNISVPQSDGIRIDLP
jgi:hypothetical protein